MWISGDAIGLQMGGGVELCEQIPVFKVCELIDQNNHSWNTPMLAHIFPTNVVNRILTTPLRWTAGKDELWWPHTSNGILSVKSVYHALKGQKRLLQNEPSTSSGISPFLWQTIWNSKVPQKIKIFLWKVVHNILPVQQNLFKKRITRSNVCPICQKEMESIEHAFLRCDWTRPVWFGLQLGYALNQGNTNSLNAWLSEWIEKISMIQELKEYSIMKLFCTLWMIWKSRNEFIFQQQNPNPLSTVIQISNLIKDYSVLNTHSEAPGSGQRRQTPMNRIWRPPLQGVTKINTDATFSNLTGFCFTGIIARDHKGSLVSGVTSCCRTINSLTAEAIALRDVVSLARNLGMERVIFESDCLDLIKACRGDLEKHQIQNFLKDIWKLKQSFVTCGFTWTPREGNEVANTIAHLACAGSLPSNWTWNCPHHLKRLIDKDRPAASR